MEVLMYKLCDRIQELEDALCLETTIEEMKNDKDETNLFKWLKRRRRMMNIAIKIIDKWM